MKKLVMVIALVMALSFTVKAGGHGKRGCQGFAGKGGHGMRIMSMLVDLDVNEDQMQKIANIMKSQREAGKANFEKMKELREKNHELMFADSFDEAAVRKNAETVAEAHVDMAVAKAKNFHEMLSVLTDEQKEKLKAKMAEKKAAMEEKMEKRKAMREKMSKLKEYIGKEDSE